MKHLKMFGLAVIAALGLMAFLGASTASATTLCTTTDTPDCTMAYTAGTTVDFSLKPGSSLRLTSPIGTTIKTCTGSTIKGKTTNTSETWVVINVEEWTWFNCSSLTTVVTTGTLAFDWIEGTHNARVRGSRNAWTTVISGVSCTYGTGEATELGTVTGGEEPVLKIETKIKKIAGSFACPSEPTLDAEYVLTEPHALYITT